MHGWASLGPLSLGLGRGSRLTGESGVHLAGAPIDIQSVISAEKSLVHGSLGKPRGRQSSIGEF